MSDPACVRCGVPVPSVLAPDPAGRDKWWRYRIGMKRSEVVFTFRFRMFRRRWLPENPHDQLRETYTELDLCDPCAADVLSFAQGRPTTGDNKS